MLFVFCLFGFVSFVFYFILLCFVLFHFLFCFVLFSKLFLYPCLIASRRLFQCLVHVHHKSGTTSIGAKHREKRIDLAIFVSWLSYLHDMTSLGPLSPLVYSMLCRRSSRSVPHVNAFCVTVWHPEHDVSVRCGAGRSRTDSLSMYHNTPGGDQSAQLGQTSR